MMPVVDVGRVAVFKDTAMHWPGCTVYMFSATAPAKQLLNRHCSLTCCEHTGMLAKLSCKSAALMYCVDTHWCLSFL